MFENEGSALELPPGPIGPWTPIEQVKLSYVIQVLISTLSRTSPIGGLGELAPPTGCGAEPRDNKIRFISPALLLAAKCDWPSSLPSFTSVREDRPPTNSIPQGGHPCSA